MAPDTTTATIGASSTFGVVATPTSCSVVTLAGSENYLLVEGSTVQVPFTLSPVANAAFGTGLSVLGAIDSISAPAVEFGAYGTFKSAGAFTITATYAGATGSAVVTLVMARTRARVTTTINVLVWPASVLSTIGDPVLGEASPMVSTLSSEVPSVVTAALSALTAGNASTGATLGIPSVSGSKVRYTLTPNSDTTYTATLTLRLGAYARTYAALTLTKASQNDASGFRYPTSLSVDKMLVAGFPTPSTLSVTPAPGRSTQCLVYVGPTADLAIATGAVNATLSAVGTTNTTLTAPTAPTAPTSTGETTFVFVRVLTPRGVFGQLIQSAELTLYTFPTAIASVSTLFVAASSRTSVTLTLTGATLVGSTASVSYDTSATSTSPTLIGTYALSKSGQLSFEVVAPATASTIYLYVKANTPSNQASPVFLVSEALGVLPDVVATDYTAFRAFVSANKTTWTAFSSEFLQAYYATMPASTRFSVFAGSSIIPEWSTSMKTPTISVDVSTTPYPTNVRNVVGQLWGPTAHGYNGYRRVWWTFSAPQVVPSIILYTNSIGRTSLYIKDEVVASNDGVNFVRIPTQWRRSGVDTVEDTFHLKFDRQKKGGGDAFWLPASNRGVMSTRGLATAPDPVDVVCGGPPGFATPATQGFGGTVVELQLLNRTAYRYYGIGSVGAESPYSDAAWTDTSKARYGARTPFGGAGYAYAGPWDSTNWVVYAVISKSDADMFPWTRQSPFGVGSQMNTAMFAIPRVLQAPSVAAPTTFKHWRIRASSSFWGKTGRFNPNWTHSNWPSSLNLWKFGLYRDVATAVADQYGISSDNYVQQTGNTLRIHIDNSSGDPRTINTGQESHLFSSSRDWAEPNVTTAAAQQRVVYDSNTSEERGICVTLDVEGVIGAIRFADWMFFDYYVRGGALIVEASTAAAPTRWVPMVCTTAGGATLGRDGIMATSNTVLNYNANPPPEGAQATVKLQNTLFSVAPFNDTYTPPTRIGATTLGPWNPTQAPWMLWNNNKVVGCTVRIEGNVWSPGHNKMADFSVHFTHGREWSVSLLSGNSQRKDFTVQMFGPDRGELGVTKFNCDVTSYNEMTGVLTFDVTPLDGNLGVFVVLVRSGEGTGITTARLRTNTFFTTTLYPDWLPSVASLTIPALFIGVSTSCSISLVAGSTVTLSAAKVISITLGTVSATSVSYNAGTGTVDFKLTPTTSGTFPIRVTLSDNANTSTMTRTVEGFVVFQGTGFTCSVVAPVYTQAASSVTIAVQGHNVVSPCYVTLFASDAATSSPATTIVASKIKLGYSGTATGQATFPSAGQWSVHARLSNADNVFYGSLVPSSGATVAVVDYALPTVLVAATSMPMLFERVAVACSITLTGASVAQLTATNLRITLGAVEATSVVYNPGTGAIGFTLTPTTRGTWPLNVRISAPLADSTFATTRLVGSFVVDDAATFVFPTDVALVSPSPPTMVQHHSTTVTLALRSPIPTGGRAQVCHASTPNDPAPTPLGTYDVDATGMLRVPFASTSTLGTVYFYVKLQFASDFVQAAHVVTTTSVATIRAYVFPTSFSVASTTFYIEGADVDDTLPCTAMVSVEPLAITATPSDTVATATFQLAFGATEGATVTFGEPRNRGTLRADGRIDQKLRLNTGGTYYLRARVTAPGGSYRDIACTTPVSTRLSPFWPSTHTTTTNLSVNLTVGERNRLGLDYVNINQMEWLAQVYDPVLTNVVTGNSQPGYTYNMCYGNNVRPLYQLSSSGMMTYFGGETPDVWWFRWGLQLPITVRRYIILCGAYSGACRFTITGYETRSFSTGTVIASETGPSPAWQYVVGNPVAFAYYEMRQTKAPFATGPSVGLVLSP
jgi:hypothetical protein